MYVFIVCVFSSALSFFFFFFFNDTATTEIYTLSLHDALPISGPDAHQPGRSGVSGGLTGQRSEEHTSELQSHHDIVCRLLLEKKKKKPTKRLKKKQKKNNPQTKNNHTTD